MERNEANNAPAEQNGNSGGCSCGCGGGKGSNKAVIAIWVVLLLGFACLAVYSRTLANKRMSEADRLLNEAYEMFERQDFGTSTELLRQSAELGNPWAQLYYGGSLKKGIGTAQDMSAAVEWFRKSADQKCAVAFYELGVCYENGEGVKRDLDEAAAWFRKARDAEFGIEEAQSALIRVEKAKALELENGASGGDGAVPASADGQVSEAERLLLQAQELFERQDMDVECAELLRQSAELGNVWAQVYYGRFLRMGIGTALDTAAAVEWFRKAAAQNCPDAFYELGVCYENGEGVERNLDEAESWYRKAVEGDLRGEAQRALVRIAKLKE